MVEEAIVFLLLSALLRFYRMLVVGDIKAELVGSPQVTGLKIMLPSPHGMARALLHVG